MPNASIVILYDAFSWNIPVTSDRIFKTVFFASKLNALDIFIALSIDAVLHTNVGGGINVVRPRKAFLDQYVSIISCDVNDPIDASGNNDAVSVTNISVSVNSTSLINSHVPTVPLLFMNVLILETSPVAGCKPEICINAYDSEFCVSVYVGVDSYVNENDEFAKFV